MSLPDVVIKFKADFSSVKDAFKSIDQLMQEHYEKFNNFQQQEVASVKDTQNRVVSAYKDAFNKINRLSEEYFEKQQKEHSKNQLRIRQASLAASQTVAFFGQNTPGASYFGNFQGTSQGITAGSSVGMAFGPAGMAVGAVVGGFVGIISDVLKPGIDIATSAIMSLAGAITTLGGAKSVTESIVEAAKLNKSGLQAGFLTAVPVSQKDRLEHIRNLSLSSGESQTDLMKMHTLMNTRYSTEKEAMGNENSIVNIHKATGMDLNKVADLYSQVQVSNPQLKDEQIRALLLHLMGQGQGGAIGAGDLGKFTQSISASGGLKGDITKNMITAFALANMSTSALGGNDKAKNASNTGLAGYFRNLQERGLGLNPEQLSEDLRTLNKGGHNAIKGLGIRGYQTLMSAETDAKKEILKSGGTEAESEDKENQIKKVMELIAASQEATITTEKFNKQLSDVNNTVEEKLKKSFNEISILIGSAFLPSIEQIIPELQNFAKWMSENKEALQTVVINLVKALESLIPIVLDVGFALVHIYSDIARAIGYTDMANALDNLAESSRYLKEQITKGGGGEFGGGGASDNSNEIKKTQEEIATKLSDLRTDRLHKSEDFDNDFRHLYNAVFSTDYKDESIDNKIKKDEAELVELNKKIARLMSEAATKLNMVADKQLRSPIPPQG